MNFKNSRAPSGLTGGLAPFGKSHLAWPLIWSHSSCSTQSGLGGNETLPPHSGSLEKLQVHLKAHGTSGLSSQHCINCQDRSACTTRVRWTQHPHHWDWNASPPNTLCPSVTPCIATSLTGAMGPVHACPGPHSELRGLLHWL